MKLFTNKNFCDFCNKKLKNPYIPINTKRNIKTFLCKKCLLVQSLPQKKFKSHPKPSMSIDADRSSIMYTKTRFLPTHIQIFKKHKINIKSFRNILDIGANRGAFVDYVRKENKKNHITAIESKKGIFNTKKHKNIKYINSRFEEAELNYGYYDFVYCVHTLEHFTSCKHALRKIFKSLEFGGKAFIVVPNLNYYSKDDFTEYFIDTHTYHFTNNFLVRFFNSVGFKIIFKIEKNDLTFYIEKTRDKDFRKKNKKFINTKKSFFDNKKSLNVYKKFIRKNRDKLMKFGTKISKLDNGIVFWGAGRLFDGIMKYGNLKFSKKFKLYDKHLFKYFKRMHNIKLLKPSELSSLSRNFNIVICSNADYNQILNEARKFKFSKILSYKKFI